MNEFEKQFSELQADMIGICMEYVEDRADKVYVYASCEEGVISSSFFYKINDTYVERHKLNEAIEGVDEAYDVSPNRQSIVLDVLNEDIGNIKRLCKEYERDMPTEMKLIYDVKRGNFEAAYKYELVYTDDVVKMASDIANEWFEEIKSNNT